MVLPLNLYSQVLASLLVLKKILDGLTKPSNIINPMLWRVFSYSSPMLPKPTIRYFKLFYYYFLSFFSGAFAGAAAGVAAGVAAAVFAGSSVTATALVIETVATTIFGVSKN